MNRARRTPSPSLLTDGQTRHLQGRGTPRFIQSGMESMDWVKYNNYEKRPVRNLFFLPFWKTLIPTKAISYIPSKLVF